MEPLPIDFGADYQPGDVFGHVFAGLPGFEDVEAPSPAPVQRKEEPPGAEAPAVDAAARTAQAGFQGSAQTLPHLERIQASFGSHDVSNVSAYVGGDAAAASHALGAQAYAMGHSVAFKDSPDLHTAAHEAAHVVQQRGGVQLKDGMGESGDSYEQHADHVANLVVAGESSEAVLRAGPATDYPESDGDRCGQGGGVQLKEETSTREAGAKPESKARADPLGEHTEADAAMIGEMYQWIADRQTEAVVDLQKHNDAKETPPFAEAVLRAVGEIALAGAFSAIGKAVEVLLAQDPKGIVAKSVAAAVNKGAREFVKKSFHAAVEGFDRNVTGDEAFFKSQHKALDDTGREQQHLYLRQEKTLLASPNADSDVANLLEALKTEHDNAYEVQYAKSLDEWANYLAIAELGRNGDGDPNAHKVLGEILQTGVLTVRVTAWTPGQQPTIKWADISGLKPEMHAQLVNRPLGAIRMTKNFTATLYGHELEFAVTPSGDYEVVHTGAVVGEWLRARAKLAGKKGAMEGLRLLVEQDLNDQTLAGKLQPSFAERFGGD